VFPSVSQYHDDASQAAGLFSVGRPQIETPQIETRKQAVKCAAPPVALTDLPGERAPPLGRAHILRDIGLAYQFRWHWGIARFDRSGTIPVFRHSYRAFRFLALKPPWP